MGHSDSARRLRLRSIGYQADQRLSSFKGTDSTFGEFPQRLQHMLAESIENTVVESVVFPAYEVPIMFCRDLIVG